MKENLALINISNIHTGGGLQVGISFIYELSLLSYNKLSKLHIVVSTEVHQGLLSLRADLSKFEKYDVINTYGIKALISPLNNRVKEYKVIFTLFGPNYLRAKGNKEIVGFAQLWILNFNNHITRKLKFMERNKLRIKFTLQWLFFLRSDYYVVELDHVKDKLHLTKKIPCEKITVIYNTISSIYIDKKQWKPITINKSQEQISLGIITRDYIHKNLEILPKVAKALEINHNLITHFYTTLNDKEWSKRSSLFKQYVSTVGSLSPEECPSFYSQVDGVIFPSLLECFSATPLEAMAMERPLFASDRSFVRDVCHNYAIYIDPLDADDIASKIANYFQSDKIDKVKLRKAREHAFDFSSAKDRAEKYLKIINDHL